MLAPPFLETNPAAPREAKEWKEFLSPHRLSRPLVSLSDATARLNYNLTYFQINYITVFLTVLFFSLVLRPLSLLLIFLPALAWCFFYSAPCSSTLGIYSVIVVGVLLATLTIVGLVLAQAWMNLLVAIAISVTLVLLHGVLWVPEDPPPYI